MKVDHVPRIDALYWQLLMLAGVFGANAADFCADVVRLGHPAALPVLLLGFACVRVAARSGAGRHPAAYWLAIALVRAAGADAADVLHDLRWSVLLAALACVTLFAWSRRPESAGTVRGAVDGLWWWTMFVAGAAGSALGDAVATGPFLGDMRVGDMRVGDVRVGDMRVGDVRAGVVLGALAALLLLARGRRPVTPGLFWPTVLALNAAANVIADGIARNVLGLELSTFAFGVGFGLVLTALHILAGGDLPSDRPRA
jgi:uncharacterized membrane-anchored protein